MVVNHDGELGPFGQMIGMITHPAATFRRLRDTGRGYEWFVITVNIMGLALVAVASTSSMARMMATFAGNAANTLGAASTGATSPAEAGFSSMVSTIGFSLAGGVALMVGDLLLRTLVVAGMNLILGGKATFKQSFRMSLWTSVPFILRYAVQSAAMFATGGQSVSGLAGALTTAESQAAPLLSTVLGYVDFYMLWSAILLAIGVSVTASVGKGKGILTTLAYLATSLGGILALQAASSALASALSNTLGTSINLPGVGAPGAGGGPSGGGPSGGPGGAPPGQ
jgi:hypothetical protein